MIFTHVYRQKCRLVTIFYLNIVQVIRADDTIFIASVYHNSKQKKMLCSSSQNCDNYLRLLCHEKTQYYRIPRVREIMQMVTYWSLKWRWNFRGYLNLTVKIPEPLNSVIIFNYVKFSYYTFRIFLLSLLDYS